MLVTDEPRVAVAAVVDGPFGEVTVANTHLSFVPGWNALQLRSLVRSLTGTREPLVLVGDLNMEQRRAARVSGLRPLATDYDYPDGWMIELQRRPAATRQPGSPGPRP